MAILICAATTTEYNAVQRALRKTGAIHKFNLLRTGMGARAAQAALLNELSNHARTPDLVISTGFAGGLSEKFEIGSWVYDASTNSVRPPNSWIEILGAVPVLVRNAEKVVHPGSNMNLSEAVDMESATLSKICSDRKIPFAVLRLISDNPRAPLPTFVGDWMELSNAETLTAKSAMFVTAFTRTIRQPLRVWGLVRNARRWRRDLHAGWVRLGYRVGTHGL
ncbi:MAG TPA: hypothetical protein PLH57_05220 [Oligoflexia bacterium]|nr:hypothetical protein [Oligoflexia bacterium]